MFFPFSSHDPTNSLTLPTNIIINVDNHDINFETKILEVTLDNKLNFEKHALIIVQKVNAKSFLLSRNIRTVSYTHLTLPTILRV